MCDKATTNFLFLKRDDFVFYNNLTLQTAQDLTFFKSVAFFEHIFNIIFIIEFFIVFNAFFLNSEHAASEFFVSHKFIGGSFYRKYGKIVIGIIIPIIISIT